MAHKIENEIEISDGEAGPINRGSSLVNQYEHKMESTQAQPSELRQQIERAVAAGDLDALKAVIGTFFLSQK